MPAVDRLQPVVVRTDKVLSVVDTCGHLDHSMRTEGMEMVVAAVALTVVQTDHSLMVLLMTVDQHIQVDCR